MAGRVIRRSLLQIQVFFFQLNVYQPVGPTFYLWRNLNPATDYAFTVSACNGFTNECGPASNLVTGNFYQFCEFVVVSLSPCLVELFCSQIVRFRTMECMCKIQRNIVLE